MSLISRPLLRGTGLHRFKSAAELRREIDEATCQLVALATEVDTHRAARDELEAERDRLEGQLDAAGIEVSGLRLDLEQANAHIKALQAQVANLTAVSVPAGERDIDPSDQPTHPVDVRPLWKALGT